MPAPSPEPIVILPPFGAGGIADVPAVARLAARSFDPHYREAWNEAQIAAILAGPGGALLLARSVPNGAPIAFGLTRRVLDEVELLLCATDPAHRRRGLGSATMRAIAGTARADGARRLFLEVRASNAPARALYESCGLVQQGRRPGYYRSVTGTAIDAITLSLDLNSANLAK